MDPKTLLDIVSHSDLFASFTDKQMSMIFDDICHSIKCGHSNIEDWKLPMKHAFYQYVNGKLINCVKTLGFDGKLSHEQSEAIFGK